MAGESADDPLPLRATAPRFEHGSVRLAIPTVIAPRYGNPASAGLEGPSIPGSNLFAEYPFDLKLDLIGLKDPNAVRSRSHACLRIQPTEPGLAVQLARQGYLDRDVALDLQHASLPHEVAPRPGR